MLLLTRLMIGGGGSSEVGVAYSFTMTAGNLGGAVFGYDTGKIVGTFGSIDAQPVPGETLRSAIHIPANFTVFAFDGDVTAKLSGLSVWVDAVNYGAGDLGWIYDSDNNRTVWLSSAATPAFADASVYAVVFQ